MKYEIVRADIFRNVRDRTRYLRDGILNRRKQTDVNSLNWKTQWRERLNGLFWSVYLFGNLRDYLFWFGQVTCCLSSCYSSCFLRCSLSQNVFLVQTENAQRTERCLVQSCFSLLHSSYHLILSLEFLYVCWNASDIQIFFFTVDNNRSCKIKNTTMTMWREIPLK